MVVVCAPARAASPLLGQWPLESSHVSAGEDLTDDVSGNEQALSSPQGTMHFGSAGGKFGGYLDNATTNILTVDSPLLAPAHVTLLAWIKQSTFPGNLKYLAGRGDDGPTCGGSSYALYTAYAAKPGLRFYVRTPTTSGLSDAPPNAAVFDGNWHLVAGTFDGAAVRLYVDGTPIGTPQPVPDAIDYSYAHSQFYVGNYPAVCDPSDWPGAIDEVRVYDRALSQTELARLAAAAGPDAPDLVPDAPPGPPPAPHEHTLLGQVTYDPGFDVGFDANAVLSPFIRSPAPKALTVALQDPAGTTVAARDMTERDTVAGVYTPVLYRFDGLAACAGCSVVLLEGGVVQDRVPVSFTGEAGQDEADLAYGRARTGGVVTGTVLTPSSLRPTALEVVVRDGDGRLLADSARLPGCAARGTCPTATAYAYRLTGLPLAGVPVTAELLQSNGKRPVVVDSAPFTLDAAGETVAPDLTAFADPPPKGPGRVLFGQLNVVKPFAPGA